MRRIRQLIDNEHGVALVLALMILLTLTGLVLAYLSASAFEPQISRNHSETVRARYVAEAGVEYAYDTLATNDGTCKVIVTSTGTIGTTTRTITLVISKTAGLPINGALAFPGAQADVSLRASSVVIDGRDTKIADRPGSPTGSESAVYGIAVNPSLPALAAGLETALAAGPQNDVRGKDKTNPSATTRGPNTIHADGTLTSQAVSDFVDAAKSTADVTINTSPGNASSLSNIGSTCPTHVESSTGWGTSARPEDVYICRGLHDC